MEMWAEGLVEELVVGLGYSTAPTILGWLEGERPGAEAIAEVLEVEGLDPALHRDQRRRVAEVAAAWVSRRAGASQVRSRRRR